jgi:hypothetical protein
MYCKYRRQCKPAKNPLISRNTSTSFDNNTNVESHKPSFGAPTNNPYPGFRRLEPAHLCHCPLCFFTASRKDLLSQMCPSQYESRKRIVMGTLSRNQRTAPSKGLRDFPACFLQTGAVWCGLPCIRPLLFIIRATLQGHQCFVQDLLQNGSPSRRMTSRVRTLEDVWVYWSCTRLADVSPVQNLSLGGLFIATPNSQSVGVSAQIDFLVQEGQIRAQAVVRHVTPASGLGLKFTAVAKADRSRLASLLTRLRSLSQSVGDSQPNDRRSS